MVIKKTISGRVFDIVNYSFMALILIIMIYPFLYVLNYSVSTPALIKNPLLLLPAGVNFRNYAILFSNADIFKALFISVSRSILGPLSMMVVTSMAGYAISRKDLIWGRFFRIYFIATMYFTAGIIPTYLLYKNLGLTGNYLVYIIPGMVNVFNMILVKTYIESLPPSLEEAVLIDGGSELDAFWRVLLPLCLPVNAAILLFCCISNWNSYIDTQLYNAMNHNLYSLQYVLYNALAVQLSASLDQAKAAAGNANRVTEQSLKMAITVVTVVPIVCVYPFLQKYFVSGLLVGSIKA